LLELATVLVVAGLLFGSVLRGMEMVDQARIRDTAADFNALSSAHLAYYDRYKALPGDDPNAARRWASASAREGTGDGVLSGNYNDLPPANPATMTVDASTGESLNFWWHLRLAGFLVGPAGGPTAATPPVNAFGGVIGVQTGGAGLIGLIACSSYLPGKIAIGTETLLDDGRPDTGTLRALRETAPNQSLGAGLPVSAYVENAATRYVLCRGL